MRDVPDSIPAALNEGLFIGDRKPIARVTVQHPNMFLRNYSLLATFSYKGGGTATKDKNGKVRTVQDADPTIDIDHGMKVNQSYADFMFTGQDNHVANVAAYLNTTWITAGRPDLGVVAGQMRITRFALDQAFAAQSLPSIAALHRFVVHVGDGDFDAMNAALSDRNTLEIPKELPNVKGVSWTRSVDTDVADCTIECWNTKPLDVGETPRAGELDLPGYYTYDRGATAFSLARWGHVRNDWFGMLMPDNIIRTYEGYGYDPDSIPELDDNLVQTGVWIIDSVATSDRGTLTIKCRDLGRILMDQQYLQPVVPEDFYDEDWQGWGGDYPGIPVTAKTKVKLTPDDSSNTPWIASGVIAGHKLKYAFDGDPNTYWLSVGNVAASKRYAYEWVQATCPNQSVTAVRVRTKKKGYTAYVSVRINGVWQGTSTIDYHRDGIGMNGGNIAYVKSQHIGTESYVDIKLPKTYAKVEAIRVTVGNLQNFHFGTYDYRGGIRDVEAYGLGKSAGKTRHLTVGPAGSNPNRYSDYTDIVKLLCAWGGFFWPEFAHLRLSDGTYRWVRPQKFDTAVLGKGVRGRVWGDFQETGTFGPAILSLSNFDKKSLMDGIAYIRDILGFIFYIDETGACVWRQPNIHDYGNRWSAFSQAAGVYVPGDSLSHQLSEDTILMSVNTTLDSKNVREAFFVGDELGKIGAFAPGFNPNPTGLRRIAGWTDQNFETQTECEVMADMLSLRQLFTYRIDQVRIPANPAIQIDDQVRIIERVTAEGYVHYVKSINSSLDMASGEWTYDMETHWLGYDNPESTWLFKPEQLLPGSRQYLLDQRETDAKTVTYTRKPSITSVEA